MEIQCQILQYYGFPYMPKDSVTPSKHYKGVAIGFFLHIVFSIFYIFTYNFRKHSSAYAKDNTLLLFLLIPAHLEVPLSMLITKEVPRARFPGGWWQAVRMKGKLPVSSTYLLAISQGNSHSHLLPQRDFNGKITQIWYGIFPAWEGLMLSRWQ